MTLLSKPELMNRLEELNKELLEARNKFKQAKKEMLEAETDMVNAKLEKEKLSAQLKSLLDQEVQEFEQYDLFDE